MPAAPAEVSCRDSRLVPTIDPRSGTTPLIDRMISVTESPSTGCTDSGTTARFSIDPPRRAGPWPLHDHAGG